MRSPSCSSLCCVFPGRIRVPPWWSSSQLMASGRGWGGEGLRFLQEAGHWQFGHTPVGRYMGNTHWSWHFFFFFLWGRWQGRWVGWTWENGEVNVIGGIMWISNNKNIMLGKKRHLLEILCYCWIAVKIKWDDDDPGQRRLLGIVVCEPHCF